MENEYIKTLKQELSRAYGIIVFLISLLFLISILVYSYLDSYETCYQKEIVQVESGDNGNANYVKMEMYTMRRQKNNEKIY
jgi:hypothetical protein